MLDITEKKAKQWARLGPRAVYGLAMLDLIERNDRVYALSADLGSSSGLQLVMKTYPERYLNVGIAEQNLIGIAAGMAKEGLIPFASSFAPFITLRCADQVRMNMGYMCLNIKTVGLGSGVSMGYLGNSHYGLEDIAVMRAIPNLTILSPADCTELVKAVDAAAQIEGPVYIRLTGIPGMPIVYSHDYEYKIGNANILREGSHIALIATGSMVAVALQVSDLLKERGISSTVIDMHTIKPIDSKAIESVRNLKMIVTMEEHSIIGGLGSAVSECLGEFSNRPELIRIGLPDKYLKAGDYSYMLDQCGLSANTIVDKILTKEL